MATKSQLSPAGDGRSTPNKLGPAGKALVVRFALDGRWLKRDVAWSFGISEARLYQILREHRERA
jgi:hypothetical protein